MAIVQEEFYHGWLIQVIQERAGYTVQCEIPQQQLSIHDTQHYATIEQALIAGRLRADLESVRLSLTRFLRSKLKLLLLYPDEREALESSISQYIDRAKHQFS
jgi:hypothetical protein